jgi:hypothetical protein
MLGLAARGSIQAPASASSLLVSKNGCYARSISKSAIVLAHPEDRLKAARRKARAALGLPPDDDDGGGSGGNIATTVMSQPAPPQRRQTAHESSVDASTGTGRTPHPEDRLKAARRKTLQSLGISVDDNGDVKERAMKNVASPTAAGAGDQRMPVCAQNNHPDYRLRIARERMLTQVKEQVEDSSSNNLRLQSLSGRAAARSDALVMSPDLRLTKARAEQASKPLQTFTPMKAGRERPKVLLTKLSSEQPPLMRNDGYSSGAVVSLRLRQERKSAIERLLNLASPSS